MSKIALSGNASGTGTFTLAAPNSDTDVTFPLPMGLTTLTDAATVDVDFSLNSNYTLTLGGNRTMGNPTNTSVGATGSIFILQDATGGRTLSWSSNWEFPGGTAPTLTTTANAVDRVDYIVRSSTSIQAVFTGDYS